MKAVFQSQRFSDALSKTLQIAVFIYQSIAIVAFVAALFLADHWLRTPFLGAFVEHTLVFNGVGPQREDEAWALYRQVKWEDQLTAVNGNEVRSAAELHTVLTDFHPGETIPVDIRTAEGETQTIAVTLHTFPSADRTTYLVIPAVISLFFLAISLWIFGLRRSESAGRAFTLFASSLALVSGGLFNVYTSHELTALWSLALSITSGALIDLALCFPQEARLVIGRPYLRWIGYVFGLIIAALTIPTLFDYNQPLAYYQYWQINYAFGAFAILFFLGMILLRSLKANSPVIKSQARTILFGTLLATGPALIWLLIASVRQLNFPPLLFAPLVLFPLSIGYTILRFRLLRTDYWMQQGVVYLLLGILVAGAYALIVSGVSMIFASAMPADNPLFIGGLVFVLAVLLEPLRLRLQGFVDSTFFRGQRAHVERLMGFGHQLASALGLEDIGTLLRQQVVSSLAPERVHIYTYDALNEQYVAMPADDGRPSSDVRFAASSPLAQYFEKEHLPLYLDGASLPPGLKAEETRLALLDSRLFVMLPGKEHPAGWLALGARLSGQPYTPRDLTFLENLCDQASVAIGRVQTVANLERRVQEMNALTRVSQGVNITLTFDDVLELIYAQTAQIIPISDLHITLYNRAGDYFYYAFCLENNDRLAGRENAPLPAGRGLSQVVVSRGRPILTQDYARECQARRVTPASQGVYAWMGVPLNAGAETIGALSVANRDPGVAYTRPQLDLIQAIADQTAGAIVKARLLQETQRRAHQLTTLNEIARQLTSTLELEPLLQNILDTAVSILDCEAGSLFLVDEQTYELIFKVTVGPVAGDLLGQRLPPGSGIVGRAVQTRAPVIENDVRRARGWLAAPDKQTGFHTKAVLAVPLQVKDRVIGVVEVINKRDGLPFVEDDQNLLTAFAGQAAVAIENARLYTLTDQELAARVEELSVMQRIDRELNASLEMDRAMRITLEWAMRQTDAEAGLIGMLEEDGLRIMAQEGYEERVAAYVETPMPLELPAMRAAVESGLPQQLSLDPQAGGAFLPDAQTQIVVPIRREAQVIGLLLLERASDAQADMAFLNRLSDHAAIAISNAQLYDEVQRANLAKSDFVSFVAHELKNPMTSIKGYTELLASGAVGAITEMQANFLNTIRANVERMSTLVSDLNDNSKIEAGRLRLEFKQVDLAEVVDEVVRSTKRQVEEKRQKLTLRLPKKLPRVWADRVRLGQVLTNLISNANKYTPEEGAITIGAEATDNQWDPEGASRVVRVWVQDTGIGIGIEDQQKIFQKFFRSEDQKAREAPGTGLGLNITKSLVEMQGGRIWFESEYRQGSTFHFTVPVAEG